MPSERMLGVLCWKQRDGRGAQVSLYLTSWGATCDHCYLTYPASPKVADDLRASLASCRFTEFRALLNHLQRHKEAGHRVPDSVMRRIRAVKKARGNRIHPKRFALAWNRQEKAPAFRLAGSLSVVED